RVAGKGYICGLSDRNHKAKLEGSWPSLVVQAERTVEKERRAGRKYMSEARREGGTRVRHWIKGLASGLATALGPAGAPIQAILSVQDNQRAERIDKILDDLIQSTEQIQKSAVVQNLIGLEIDEKLARLLTEVGINLRRLQR